MDSQQSGEIVFRRRRITFENSRFRVFADHIADSRGNEVEDFLVVVPRSQRTDLLTGVVVIPVRDRQILFLNSYRHAVARRVLEVPRGFLDADEQPTEAALRELGEETGLMCAPESLLSLGVIQPEPGVLSARAMLFAATDCQNGGQPLQDEIGIDERLWFPITEVRRMLFEYEIEEASTCVALHRYFLFADRQHGR